MCVGAHACMCAELGRCHHSPWHMEAKCWPHNRSAGSNSGRVFLSAKAHESARPHAGSCTLESTGWALSHTTRCLDTWAAQWQWRTERAAGKDRLAIGRDGIHHVLAESAVSENE